MQDEIPATILWKSEGDQDRGQITQGQGGELEMGYRIAVKADASLSRDIRWRGLVSKGR